eukprot:6311178-Karenia_brevis.AAC.1
MIGIVNTWEGDVGREWVTSQWDLDHSPKPWSRVKGPMGASHMHLKDMGWQTQWSKGALLLRHHGRRCVETTS